MRFGLSFPQRDIGSDPGAIRDFVQTAEELGFDRLTVVDHVLVAKQAVEVDILSGGRLILGVGLGWNEVEYQALGMNFADRGRRIEEQVALIRRLWSEPVLAFDGEWHRFEQTGLAPRPIQSAIPIWFGAEADVAIRRAARLGDGWFVFPHMAPGETAGRKIALFRDTARAEGRDADALAIDASVYARGAGPGEWVERSETWLELGANQITFRTTDCGFSSIDEHIAAMRQFSPSAR